MLLSAAALLTVFIRQLTSAQQTYDDQRSILDCDGRESLANSGADRKLDDLMAAVLKLQHDVERLVKKEAGNTSYAGNDISHTTSPVQTGCVCPEGAQLTSNLALNKPAFQSSTHRTYRAYLANDGNRNTDFGQGSCSHTLDDTNPWWAVDLGHEICVVGVTFVNRGDCCGERSRDFIIGLTNESPVGRRPSVGNYKTFGQWRGAVGQGATVQMQNRQGTSGRYVIVQLSRLDALHFCELEVYGCAV